MFVGGVVGGLHFVAEMLIPQSRKIRTKNRTVRINMEKGLGMAQRARLTFGRCAYMLQANSPPFFHLCGRSVALCERGTEKAHCAGRWGSCAPAETSSRKPGTRAACEDCLGSLRTHLPELLALDPLLPLRRGVAGDVVAAVDVADLLVLHLLFKLLL